MQQKAAGELVGGNSHDPGVLLVFVAIVFPLKRDLSVLQGNKPLIGDGNPMGIATEIGERLLRASEGWFGIDDPFPFLVRRHTVGESKGVPEWFDRAEEVQKSLIKSIFQEFEERGG